MQGKVMKLLQLPFRYRGYDQKHPSPVYQKQNPKTSVVCKVSYCFPFQLHKQLIV